MRVGGSADPGGERAGVRYDSRRALARAAGGRRGRWGGQPRHACSDRPRPRPGPAAAGGRVYGSPLRLGAVAASPRSGRCRSAEGSWAA
jgi:hypothetical protein